MKTTNIFLKMVIVIFIGLVGANADSVSPTSKKIASNTSVSISLRYTIIDPSTPPDICTGASSPSGQFTVPGALGATPTVLGTDSRTLHVAFDGVNGDRKYVNTRVRVPYSVLKKAQNLGKNKIIYTRTFGAYTPAICPGNGMNPMPINTTINVTSQMAASLGVNKIKLYFDNKRPIASVSQYEKLNVYASVGFVGSGYFKAYWEVDGRKVSYVIKNISYAHNEIFKYPNIPALPTFSEGTHVVKFIITTPKMEIIFPKAVYYVNANINGKLQDVKLLSPIDGKYYLSDEHKIFTWQKNIKDKIFVLEFFESISDKPIFSAIVRDSKYELSNRIIETKFKKGEEYYWQVKGYDEAGINTSISEKRKIKL